MAKQDQWHLGSAGSQAGSPAQWVKDPASPQLWLGSKLQLRSDSWPGNSMCCGAAKNEKENHGEAVAGT